MHNSRPRSDSSGAAYSRYQANRRPDRRDRAGIEHGTDRDGKAASEPNWRRSTRANQRLRLSSPRLIPIISLRSNWYATGITASRRRTDHVRPLREHGDPRKRTRQSELVRALSQPLSWARQPSPRVPGVTSYLEPARALRAETPRGSGREAAPRGQSQPAVPGNRAIDAVKVCR